MQNRQKTARLLTDNDLMPFVKSMAKQFGDNGKLPFVGVKTKTDSAYFGRKF